MKQDSNWHSHTYWHEHTHQSFYEKLRELPAVEQREAIIHQARSLSLNAKKHPENLPAVESLLSYLLQNISNTAQEKEEAAKLIQELKQKMKA